MAQPITMEKRSDIIKHMQAGESKENIAKWLFICIRTITRIWNKYIATGSYEPAPPNSGRKALVSEEIMRQIVAEIKATPDITLREIIEKFNLPITESALCKRLIKLGLRYKKKHSIRRRRSARTSLKREASGKVVNKK